MTRSRNILTFKLQRIKIGARRLRNTKFWALLMISAVLAGTLYLSPAISSLTDSVIIGSSGQFSTDLPTITAASGYWQDIQVAVDEAATYGIANVYIPEGTFNFVNVGEGWTGYRVTVPAGINVFGALTERTSGLEYNGTGQNPNDQVVEWKTILVMPWDAPTATWFKISGNGDPNKPSRFSDIKLVGYRSIDQNSTTKHRALNILSVIDFRVDHCYFENLCGGIFASGGGASWYDDEGIRGVVDHCFLVNSNGIPAPYDQITVGYGVHIGRSGGDLWENDVSKVLGRYNNYTVFIEDCYFEKWRHVTSGNTGAHYVFRHNTVEDDFGYGSVDSHGYFQTACYNHTPTLTNPQADWNGTDWVCHYCGAPLRSSRNESPFIIRQVGTRATEIYNNKIINAIQYEWGTNIRGGAGVSFNNYVGGGTYEIFMWFWNDVSGHPEGSKILVNDWYIWNNTLLGGMDLVRIKDPASDPIIEGENYYLHAPTFDYISYPYPHPLTFKAKP